MTTYRFDQDTWSDFQQRYFNMASLCTDVHVDDRWMHTARCVPLVINAKLSRSLGRYGWGRKGKFIDIQGMLVEFFSTHQPGSTEEMADFKEKYIQSLLVHELTHAYLHYIDHPDGNGHTSTFHRLNNAVREELGLPRERDRFDSFGKNPKYKDAYQAWIDWRNRFHMTSRRKLTFDVAAAMAERYEAERQFRLAPVHDADLIVLSDIPEAPIRSAIPETGIAASMEKPSKVRLTLDDPDVVNALLSFLQPS